MSGLEIVGVAASILQIAEMGRTLSINLSSNVSFTCSALHELGTALEQDDQARVCSGQAFHGATKILEEYKTVFQQTDNAIEKQTPGTETNRIQRGIRQVAIAFFGPDLDILKSKLERQKSTMLLTLNVITHAAQIRRYVGF